MKSSEIFDAAATLLTPSGAWIQGTLARDSCGYRINPRHPAAACWCAVGAISKVSGLSADPVSPVDYGSLRGLSVMVAKANSDSVGRLGLDMLGLMTWNDQLPRTQEDVVAAFHKAAEYARRIEGGSNAGSEAPNHP